MTSNVNLHTAPADAGDSAILPNLLMFGEVLRRMGLDFGTANMLDLVRATEHVPIGGNRNDFRLAARALLVHRRSDLPLFDEAFQVFWRRPAHGASMRDLRSMGEERRYRTPRVTPHREDTSDGPPSDDLNPTMPATVSRWWICSGRSAPGRYCASGISPNTLRWKWRRPVP